MQGRYECSTPPNKPVRWRCHFRQHHCAVSRVWDHGGRRADVVEQTAYKARQVWSIRSHEDPEQCEVSMAKGDG